MNKLRNIAALLCLTAFSVSAQQFCKTEQEAVDYCAQMIRSGKNNVSVILPFSVQKQANSVAHRIAAKANVTNIHFTSQGSTFTFTPVVAASSRGGSSVAITNSNAAGDSKNDRKAVAEADKIVAKVASRCRTEYEKALALHDYFVTNSRYRPTDEPDYNDELYYALVKGRGACSGYARAYALLCTRAGLANYLVIGKHNGSAHAWNVVRLDGKWVHIDTTFDDPMPDMGEHAVRAYFAMSDSQIAVDHSWNRKQVPACNSPQLYYYNRYNHVFKTIDDFYAHLSTCNVQSGYYREAIINQVEKMTPRQAEVAMEAAAARYRHLTFRQWMRHPALKGHVTVHVHISGR